MYCPECGTAKDESKRFCPKCGFDFENEGKALYEAATGEVRKDNEERKVGKSFGKTFGLFIAIFSIAIIGIVSFIFFSIFKNIQNYASDADIEIGSYTVTSFNKVTGKSHKVCNSRQMREIDQNTFIGIGFCSTLEEEELNQYFNYLVVEEGFVVKDQYDVFKEQNGYVLRVYYDGQFLSYSYSKIKYEEESSE